MTSEKEKETPEADINYVLLTIGEKGEVVVCDGLWPRSFFVYFLMNILVNTEKIG